MDDNYYKSKKVADHIVSAMLEKKSLEHGEEFDKWLKENKSAAELVERLRDAGRLSDSLREFSSIDKKNSADELLRKIDAAQKRMAILKRRRIVLKYVASVAASAVLLFFAWQYVVLPFDTLKMQSGEVNAELAEKIAAVDVLNNAILVLESGEKIDLHSTMDGMIANATIENAIKLENTSKKIPHNTIITPAGVTYHVILSDGTKVWLNENSKLVYPVKFYGAVREITLEGEAYFEVATNRDTAFVVNGQNSAKIKVLGTKFNVNNKKNCTYTTLVEGSVEVNSDNDKVIIKPSEQAVVSPERKTISISEVDISVYTAWKDGRYAFVDETLSGIMSKISEWYNIDIEYDCDVTPHLKLSGSLRKYKSFNEIVQVMEATGLIEIKIKDENSIKVYRKKVPATN